MTTPENLLAGGFGLWLVLGMTVQLPPFRAVIQRRDVLNLVPAWNFFAPTPGQGDYHLLVRYQDADDTITDWRELSLHDSRPAISFLWNPEKRIRKALFDVAQAAATLARASDGDLVVGTIPYLAVLNHVVAAPREPGTTAVQFLVMFSHGVLTDREPEPVMLSELHDLDE